MKCPNCQASRMRIKGTLYYCLNCDYDVDFDEVGDNDPSQTIEHQKFLRKEQARTDEMMDILVHRLTR